MPRIGLLAALAVMVPPGVVIFRALGLTVVPWQAII
jgi:hypothetical protein